MRQSRRYLSLAPLLFSLWLLSTGIVAAADEAPLTVHYEYQLGGEVSDAQKEVLERALGIIGDYLESTFTVKRSEGPTLYLDAQCTRYVKWFEPINTQECIERELPPLCGSAATNPDLFGGKELCDRDEPNRCRTEPGGQGIPGAQLAIYVTSTTTLGCSSGSQVSEMASAVWCTKSWRDQRPTSGNVNICPKSLEESTTSDQDFYRLLDTLLHEIVHVLGFNPDNFPDFVDGNGDALGIDKVLRTEENGANSLITANVVSQARAHFNCDEISSVPLEASGGAGTAGAHWPAHVFGPRELMIATIGDQRSVVSNMTLSVLEDSGWYKVNYSEGQLGRYKFGLGMGCSLFGDCNADKSRYYCDEEERNKESLCTSDFYSVGKCTIGPFGGQCSTVQPFANMMCRDSSVDADSLGYKPEDWGQYYGESARCLPIASQPPTWELGTSAFSFMAIPLGGGAACFKVGCSEDGKRIRVSLGAGREAECEEGGYVDASSLDSRFRQGKIGPCPSPDHFCSSLGCPGDCSVNGDCDNGKCFCYLGSNGKACESRGIPANSLNSVENPSIVIPSNTGMGLDALSNSSQNMSALATTEVEVESKGIPLKAIVISAIVGVGLVAGAATALVLYWRRRSHGPNSKSARRRYSKESAMVQTQRQQAPPPSSSGHDVGLKTADLDGGLSGVKHMNLLYGNDIQL